jgi:PAS domain S-box-containing protein
MVETNVLGSLPASNARERLNGSSSLSELRYRRLFEAARDGILIVDPRTRRIVDVNPFLEEFLGYSHAEFIGKELHEIGLLKDEVASRLAFQELLANGFIRYDDLPLRTKAGRTVAVEFVSNVYQEGNQQIIQCNVRDISARKRVEEALRQSEERFKLLTCAVSDVVWDWNLENNSMWWSDELLSPIASSTKEIGHDKASWDNRIHPEDRSRIVEGKLAAINAEAESWCAEYRFRLANGKYADVWDSGYILRDWLGKGIRMVGGIRDITEQKKSEIQSIRAHRMESLGTLAGGIAHDLNNVLTPVMMSIELLKSDASSDSGRKEILDTIQVSCRRGADLVRQVLTFTRGLDGQRVPIQMQGLTDELVRMMRDTFPRNIKIEVDVSTDLWPITGDPSQIHQLMLNLAVNARDAMPSGGVLRLSATNVALDPRDLGSSRESTAGRHVLLEVTDTGTGISPDNCEHIFEPFFTTKKIGQGTGFGLAIVHAVAKSHGGFVTVESEIGRGTTFKISLPADPKLRTVGSLPPFKADVPRGRGELVLVVDDEDGVREITERTLKHFDYRVVTAENGAVAVDIYSKQAEEIDLVVTDMTMPVMDGPSAVKAIKRINPAAKIVAVSGISIDDETKANVSNFLAKPYSALDLIKTIREVLDMPLGSSRPSVV